MGNCAKLTRMEWGLPSVDFRRSLGGKESSTLLLLLSERQLRSVESKYQEMVK